MSKDNKNTDKKFIAILKTILSISVIAIITYAIMAVITHFSLNFELENYSFRQSLISIFNTDTAIFKFFTGFMILNIIWLSFAVIIHLIKKSIVKKEYE